MPDKSILEKIINAVLQVIVPDKIILFGSQARGEAREYSDYDILVIKTGIKDEIGVAQDIYEKLDIAASIDLVVVTPENIDKYKKSKGSIIEPALNDGVLIYGQ
jgi:predicted nucleotidyltransferase